MVRDVRSMGCESAVAISRPGGLTFESGRRFSVEGMRISELAERTGVPATTLRFYEGAGLLRAARTSARYRDYGADAVERLGFIRAAKGFGLSLEEIGELLPVWESGICDEVKGGLEPRVRGRLAGAQVRLAELGAFVMSLRGALRRIEESAGGDGPCDSDCVCLGSTTAVTAGAGCGNSGTAAKNAGADCGAHAHDAGPTTAMTGDSGCESSGAVEAIVADADRSAPELDAGPTTAETGNAECGSSGAVQGIAVDRDSRPPGPDIADAVSSDFAASSGDGDLRSAGSSDCECSGPAGEFVADSDTGHEAAEYVTRGAAESGSGDLATGGDAQCGSPSAATLIASVGTEPAAPIENSGVRIACSLDDGDMAERIGKWRTALQGAAHKEISGGVAMSVPPELAGEIAELVVAEQKCCPFFDFRLQFRGGVVEFEVRAPMQASAMLARVCGKPDHHA